MMNISLQDFRTALIDILAFGADNGSPLKVTGYERVSEDQVRVIVCEEHNLKRGEEQCFLLTLKQEVPVEMLSPLDALEG